jgi:signal transduction histidine kinase/ligand-binding sensor domain-containing protein
VVRRIALVVVLLIAVVGPAAAGRRLVRRLGSEHGLPVASITALAQDARGFLWIATDGGIVRYDGADLVPVARDALRTTVELLAPDGDGVLAISSGVVWRVDDAGARRVDGAPDAARGVARDGRGRLWVAPWRGALRVRDADGGPWRDVALDDVWVVEADGDGVVAATRDTVWTIDGGAPVALGTVTDIEGALVDVDVVRDAAGARASVVAMVSAGRVVEIEDGVVRELWREAARGISVVARGEQVWAAFDTIVAVRHVDGTHEALLARDGVPSGGPLLVDREGALWLGTFQGLLELPEPRTIALGQPEGLPSGHARFLFRERDAVWVATWQGLGFVVDGPVPTARTEAGAPHAHQPICRDAQGRMWTRGGHDAIAVRSPDGTWTTRPAADGYVGCVRAGDVTYVTTGRGLWLVGDDGALIALPAPPLDGGLTVRVVDVAGGVWVTGGGTVCRGDPAAAWTWACHSTGSIEVTDLIEAAPGLMWAATHDAGLMAGDATRGFAPVPGARALPSATLLGLSPGQGGTTWVLGHGAILRARPRPDLADGIEILESLGPWNGVATDVAEDVVEDADGTVWLTCSMGVVRVPAIARGAAPAPPPVYLVSALIDGAVRSPDSRLEVAHDGVVELTFAAPALRDPARLRYRVRHDGGAWSPAGHGRSFRMAGLAPGTHVAEVQASLDGEAWSPSVRVAVVVTPPWWRRWWAYAGAAAVLIAIGWMAHRARLAVALRLERQRARIAMDLHDEVGSGLASIGLLASVAGTDALPGDQRRAVADRIAAQSQDLGAALADIVTTLRTGDDSLASFAEHLAEAARRLVPGPSPSLALALPAPFPEVELSLPVRRNVHLLAIEAVHNAVKHADATAIILAIEDAGGRRWRLTVSDNGKGLGPPRPGGMGLINMKRRAADIGAEIEWTTPGGGGTAVSVTFQPRAQDQRVERRLGRAEPS